MYRAFLVSTLVVVFVTISSATAASAPQPKVDLCHANDGGGYHPISVAGRAAPAHLAHGDGLIGDPVQGMDGPVFGVDCLPVVTDPPAVDPITPGCYASNAGFNDTEYVGPKDAPGNVVSWLSFDGSCSGMTFGGGEAIVTAPDLDGATSKCEAIGLLQEQGVPLNLGLGYAGLPLDAWFCNVP